MIDREKVLADYEAGIYLPPAHLPEGDRLAWHSCMMSIHVPKEREKIKQRQQEELMWLMREDEKNEWRSPEFLPNLDRYSYVHWFLAKFKSGSIVRIHFAQDLSGDEQPPFSGWFRQRESGNGFMQIDEKKIVGWKELPEDEPKARWRY